MGLLIFLTFLSSDIFPFTVTTNICRESHEKTKVELCACQTELHTSQADVSVTSKELEKLGKELKVCNRRHSLSAQTRTFYVHQINIYNATGLIYQRNKQFMLLKLGILRCVFSYYLIARDK